MCALWYICIVYVLYIVWNDNKRWLYTVADHLKNAGFNATAKSEFLSLLESMSGENTVK